MIDLIIAHVSTDGFTSENQKIHQNLYKTGKSIVYLVKGLVSDPQFVRVTDILPLKYKFNNKVEVINILSKSIYTLDSLDYADFLLFSRLRIV